MAPAPVPPNRPTAPTKPRFRYLEMLAKGIDQLHHETEHEAKKLVEGDLAGAYRDKDEVFEMARERLAGHKDALGDFRGQMADIKEQLMSGSNSGEQLGDGQEPEKPVNGQGEQTSEGSEQQSES